MITLANFFSSPITLDSLHSTILARGLDATINRAGEGCFRVRYRRSDGKLCNRVVPSLAAAAEFVDRLDGLESLRLRRAKPVVAN